MIYVIGVCEENCFLASRVYAQRFPERRHPDVRSLENLKERFDRTGSVAYEKKTRTKPVLNEENSLAISLAIVENPRTSVRDISRDLVIKKSPVSKCIKQNKFHPYHSQLHQELIENDFEKRVTFCQWAQNQLAENDDFFKFVLFTDECTFHRNGFANRHNYHYYDTQNPHIVEVNNYQHNWSLNVWGGIVHNFVIGPHIFEGHVTGEVFLNFLTNDFPRLVQHLPDYVRNQMWLQLDGAPPHFSANVRQHLNENFPERWIGRQGPSAWPPRSPDLTPMDFFLWGTVKSDVYRTAATTREDMVQRIRQSFESITPAMLDNVRRSFRRRIMACVAQNGQHFEQLLH